MDVLLAAGVAGLAGYALGKRRERRQVQNGFVTFNNGSDAPTHGNFYYGNTGAHHHPSGSHQSHKPHHQSHQHHHHSTSYGYTSTSR